ncbi:MAG: hypothetical protein JWR82_345 [Blastococcus sp.]|nr:hypothetical protein [Blastococcus sp.]
MAPAMAAAPATDEARPAPGGQERALRAAARVVAQEVSAAAVRTARRGPKGTAPVTTAPATGRVAHGADLPRVTIGRPAPCAGARASVLRGIAPSGRTVVRPLKACNAPRDPGTRQVNGRSVHRTAGPRVTAPPVGAPPVAVPRVIVRRAPGRTAALRVTAPPVAVRPVIVRRVPGRTAVLRVTAPPVAARPVAVPRVLVRRVRGRTVVRRAIAPPVVARPVTVRSGPTGSRPAAATGATVVLQPADARRRAAAPDAPPTIVRTDARRFPRARKSPTGSTLAVSTRPFVTPCVGSTRATPNVSPPTW